MTDTIRDTVLAAFIIGMLLFVLIVASTPPQPSQSESSITVHGALSKLWYNATSIEWGTIRLGSTVQRGILFNNTGTQAYSVSMTATDWQPNATRNYLTFHYEPVNATLMPLVPAAFLLALSASMQPCNITEFTFNIVVNTTT